MHLSDHFQSLGRAFLRKHKGKAEFRFTRNAKGVLQKLHEIHSQGVKGSESRILNAVGSICFYRKKIRATPPGVQRARKLHALIDSKIDSEKTADPSTAAEITCKRGCSFCCYQQVTITSDEAKLLFPHLTPERTRRLEEQLPLPEDATEFAKHWPKTKCAFLEEDGSCSVYEDRPAVCRTALSIADPQLCDTQLPNQSTEYFNAVDAELIITAAFTEIHSGPMASMILE